MMTIIPVTTEGEALDSIRTLFREYETGLDEDLCFQSFETELKDPLKKYGAPQGVLLLAHNEHEAVGCIALTPLATAGVCEMKRLFVRPAYRKHGIARQLVALLLLTAKEKGYHTMKLDTLQKLQSAIALYEQHGFVHTGAYYNNPIAGVVYMQKTL
jgi:GNAT superfamily N-acetyltransferase